MPPIGTLYLSDPGQARGTIIRAVAALTKTELLPTPPEYEHFQTNSTPEWRAKFPLGKVPAFEGVNGFRLTEGIAIARYLANRAGRTDLLGSTPKAAALVDQWQSFAVTELGPPVEQLYGINYYWTPFPGQETYDALVKAAERSFDALNYYIAAFGPDGSKRRFVATEDTLTLADLALSGYVAFASGWFLDDARRAKWPELARYFEGVVGFAEELREFYGTLDTCEKAESYVPKAEGATQ